MSFEYLRDGHPVRVTLERSEWEAGRRYIDRILGDRIARRAFGDSTAKRRDVPEDVQLMKALELLRARKWTMTVLYEPSGRVGEAYQPSKMPAVFVIDRDGTISTAIEGAFSAEELERAVQRVSGAPSA